jgi:hypothetical protein
MKKKNTMITTKLNSNEPGIVNVVMIPVSREAGVEPLQYLPVVKSINLAKFDTQ